MIHTSTTQKMKILIIYLFYGLGIGLAISLVVSLNAILPDTIESMLIVTIPICIIFTSLRAIHAFNTIKSDETSLTIVSFLKKRTTYSKNDIKYSFSVKEYTVFGANYAPLLYLYIFDEMTKRKTKYLLAPYSKNQIMEILNTCNTKEVD